MSNIHEQHLSRFIAGEKAHFEALSSGVTWEDDKWDVRQWLFHRGQNVYLLFTSLSSTIKSVPMTVALPPQAALPAPFSDFVKAMAVYLQRTKNISYIAVRNYVTECRRIHIFMHARGESCPTRLTRWHFESVMDFLTDSGYKNLYDSSANLKVIAEFIDKKQLTPYPVGFNALKTAERSHFNYKVNTGQIDDSERVGGEKLPSYEAMQAYALCTNHPIDDNEEILLRTIDLLIAMGQRGNEVALIPLDCWVQKTVMDTTGNPLSDAHGLPIIQKGIRYYAEKNFQSRVHWLAEQDIAFAFRAVERLRELTQKIRAVADWQEQNPGKLWSFVADEIIEDSKLLQFIGFSHTANLHLYLNRNGVKPAYINKEIRNPLPRNRSRAAQFYKAGDIEQLLLPKLSDHGALKEKVNGRWKTLLRTSEVLSIRFEGAYRLKERNANIFTVFPGRTELKDINGALGAIPGIESIFDRRKLTEADDSRIVLTSHQPRHWRNTLYELAGMSNVQQALALGRQRLDQNPTYQHTSLSEKTELHKDFLSFSGPAEKVNFLYSGIKSKQILGEITDTYHRLLADKGEEKANAFLSTHALAIHVTPFGGCTHDFSQAPCSKHLQCWNGCSHLHRTHLPGETERIEEQLRLSQQILAKMKAEGYDEYGSERWTQDIEKKIGHLQKALEMTRQDSPTPVFPDGTPVTIPEHMKKGSSVK